MADASVFEFVCAELERATSLSRLEVRGTVRLALKQAGFDASKVRSEEMAAVLRKVLPAELLTRGVSDGAPACETIARGLARFAGGAAQQTPEDVFRRLGGGA
jgi:uncharacterized protein YaaW (UPF0174 family)